MRGGALMSCVVVSLGIATQQAQSQSIPEEIRTLKDAVARLEKLVEGAGPATIRMEEIAVFNRHRQPVVLLRRSPKDERYGYIAVGDGRHAYIELHGQDTGKGFITVKGKRVHDYAELFELASRDGVQAGSVMAYDPVARGLVLASVANARQVVGVVSGAGGLRPAMVIGSRGDGSRDFPISMSGVVYVRVSGEAGAIEAGDLLVPSSVVGVGMRSAEPSESVGRVFGKALEPRSDDDEGLVLMLVMNR